MKISTFPMTFGLQTFRLIAVSVLMSFALLSCNSDDDDMITFLDAHGGTQWKFDDPNSETELYLKISESEANPFELWLKTFLSNDCYVYQSVEDDGTPEILENNENRLVIRLEESNEEYTLITLNVSQNVLTVEFEYYENGQLDDDNGVIMFANNDDISNIEVCAF